VDEKTARMIMMRDKKRVRIGKQPAVRSQKPSIKQVETVKEVNPERLAFLMYLGHLEGIDEAVQDN
jgi:hypothetical protein